MGDILKRAAKLRDQMDNAVDDDKRTPWESIHGVHNIPKSYVPPFQTNEMPQGSQPIDMDKLDNIIIDMEAAQSQPPQYGRQPEATSSGPLMTNFKALDNEPQARQILEMKYIYIKIGKLQVNDKQLISQCIDQNFRLYVKVPLPDVVNNTINYQNIQLNNYDVVSHNEYDFNSTQSYFFKINAETLAQFSESPLIFYLQDQQIIGEMKMNQVILASHFNLEYTVDLLQKIPKKQEPGRAKKEAAEIEYESKIIGNISFQMNL